MDFQAVAAYDLLPDGLVVLDADGVVTYLNPAASRLTGVDIDKALGQPADHVLPLSSLNADDWWDCCRPLAKLGSVHRQPEQQLTLRSTGLRSASPERAVLVTVAWLRDGVIPTGRLVSLRDAKARERIERSSADLISTVSHELRSPLTSIKGFTATLLAKWDRFPDEQKQVMLQTVNADADRVTRLLTELLDVSRIDAGRMQIHKQVVDLKEIVDKVIEGRIAAGDEPDRFVISSDGQPPEMWLDPDKMLQILGNLVENGVRHGEGTIRIALMAETDGISVSVSDEGEGVPPDAAGRIFTKFWRGQPRRGGTGLGLYICKGLVEAHGGTMTVGSGPGGGAEFRFRLPAGAPSYAM